MPTRYTVICDDTLSREIQQLARENDITEGEALRQLARLGLETLNEEAPV